MEHRKIILKVLILGALLSATYYYAAYRLSSNFVDVNYSKFTYASNSLIIGSSRAHDGVAPQIIDSILGNQLSSPTLNFAFERSQSSFGQTYLDAILKKIDTSKKDGLFIISVNPGSFLISNRFGPNVPKDIDQNTMIGKMTEFNKHPNLEFVRKCYNGALYRSFLPEVEKLRKVHKNGWIEFRETIGNYTVSETKISEMESHTNQGYLLLQKHQTISDYRISAFKKTVSTLTKYGNVFVIRMPVNNYFLEKEEAFWPEFNQLMSTISYHNNSPYINYTKTNYKFKMYDGSHMFGNSAKYFTTLLSKDIDSLFYSNN